MTTLAIFRTSGVEADITIDNFVLKNLATFETQDLHLDLLKLHLDAQLTLPKLRVRLIKGTKRRLFCTFFVKGDAVYSLDGSIFNLLPLYGDGDMFLELNELSIDVQGGLLITADGFLQVSDLEMDASFQSANLHLDNLLGGGDFGENINNLLTALAPTIWNEVRPLEIQIFQFYNCFLNVSIFSSRIWCSEKSTRH